MKKAGWGLAGVAAASGRSVAAGSGRATGAPPSEHDGTVSTRGHFDVTWWNGVYLTPGHTAEGYDVVEPVPGLDGTSAPEEVVVFAHGWLVNDWTADTNFAYLDGTLAANDYTHPVVGYEWDADEAVAVDDWYPSVEIARRNGRKLAAFLRDYRGHNPETTVRLVGHSLGAEVTLSTLSHLAGAGRDDVVDSLTLLGAAVEDDAPALDGEYGEALGAAGAVDNFHSRNDGTLATGFTAAEWDAALGNVGAEGETPANYEDHAVPSVSNHLAYFLAEEGCLDQVAAEWRTDDGAGDDGSDVRTHTETGTLSGPADADVYTYRTRTDDPGEVVLELTGSGDFDLYATTDGRTPTTGDFDARSWNYGSDERISLDGLGTGATLGVLVDAYDGSGNYRLVISETG